MFDSGSVSAALANPDPVGSAGTDRAQTLDALRARIRGLERRTLRDDRGMLEQALPTHPALGAILPGGAMRAGSVYAVDRSAALTIAMLAGPSRAGRWAAVVGIPEFGIEAAADAGVRLDRLVLVPRPGDDWISTVGVLAEVMGVIAVRAPRGAAPGALDRLAARLRRHGCALVVTGTALGGDAVLSVGRSRWHGIGDGHGFLAERELRVLATTAGGMRREAVLRIPERAAVPVSEPVSIPVSMPTGGMTERTTSPTTSLTTSMARGRSA